MIRSYNCLHMMIGVILLASGGCRHGHDSPSIVAAARNGEADLIATLVKQGADPNVRSGNGWTPLMHAIHKNQKASVTALLDAGADVNRRGEDGTTPLMMAAGYGYTDIVNVVLDRGANPYAELKNGETALSFAVLGVPDIDRFTMADCQIATVKALLDRAPDLRFHGPSGILRGVTIAKMKSCPGLAEATRRRNR